MPTGSRDPLVYLTRLPLKDPQAFQSSKGIYSLASAVPGADRARLATWGTSLLQLQPRTQEGALDNLAGPYL